MVLDGLVVLPEAVVGVAEVAQVAALAFPVSDLLGDGQRLVVVLDGLVVLPAVAVGVALVIPSRHTENGLPLLAVCDFD